MNGQSKSDVCMYVYVYTNTYTMDCYSAFINKGILPFVTTWKDSDGITQSEISQTLKDKHNMILLICVSKKKNQSQIKKTDWRLLEARVRDG